MLIKKGKITAPGHDNYIAKIGIMSDIHVGYDSWGDYTKLKNVVNGINNNRVDFCVILGDCVDSGYRWTPELKEEQVGILNEHMAKLKSPLFRMKGNHDADVNEFTEFGSIIFSGIFKLICIYPKWVGMSDDGSRGRLSEEEIDWIEEQLQDAQDNNLIPIVLSHYAVHTVDTNFKWPICDVVSAQTDPSTTSGETYDGHRDDLVALLDEYNVPLFINGHEHRRNLVNDTVDDIDTVNVQIGSTTAVYVIMTVYEDKVVFVEYNSETNEETGYDLEISLS